MGGLYIREGVQFVLMPVDVVLIGCTPQHVVDDHGDLRTGDALVGTEAAVSPGNPTVAGGLGHIVVEPVTGGHIPEVTVEILREIEHFQIDFAAFEQALTPHTKGVVVNSPNNPSAGALQGPPVVHPPAAQGGVGEPARLLL